MRTSPLQLRCYFVAELAVTANRDHDPRHPLGLTADDLSVNSDCATVKDDPRQWQVTLRIQQQSGPGTNAPYYFTVELVGHFVVLEKYPVEKAEWMVRTNATSLLFTTAREVLRGVMAQGPFPPLLLPTASFYTPENRRLLDAANAQVAANALPETKAAKRLPAKTRAKAKRATPKNAQR